MANAASRQEARSRVLLVAGGPSCRATQRDFFSMAFRSIGIGMLPDEAFGEHRFEMDWMDTRESEQILEYQRHSWADFEAGFETRMRVHRFSLAPIRPLVRRGLLHFSTPWKRSRAAARGLRA
jgi:hypothetical protein